MTALILDCDGVLAETELDGHRVAYNETFAELGLPVHWSPDEYRHWVGIAGAKQRFAALFTEEFVTANGLPRDAGERRALFEDWHRRKTKRFNEIARAGRLPVRPGIGRLVGEALTAGWTVAVASIAAERSVRAVLVQAVGHENASRCALFAGEVAGAMKPDPAIYRLAIERLGLTPNTTIVIEDSRIGLLAATRAGLRCIVTPSYYTLDDDTREAVLVLSSLGDPGEPARILANRGAAQPGAMVTLADLEACLADALPSRKAG